MVIRQLSWIACCFTILNDEVRGTYWIYGNGSWTFPSKTHNSLALLRYSRWEVRKNGSWYESKEKIFVIELVYPETIVPIVEQTQYVSTVTWWVMYFSDVVVWSHVQRGSAELPTCEMHSLVHQWRLYIANIGKSVEQESFVPEKKKKKRYIFSTIIASLHCLFLWMLP